LKCYKESLGYGVLKSQFNIGLTFKQTHTPTL
jgi:hypothetical protein